MRTVSWMLIAALAIGLIASGQAQVQLPSPGTKAPTSAPAPPSADLQDTNRIIFAVSSNLEKRNLVEGLPYAATGKIVLEQTLADGSAVSNSYDIASWRDAEGRLRVEFAVKLPGLDHLHHMVFVWDPNSSTTMTWTTGNPQVHYVQLRHVPAIATPSKKTGSLTSSGTSTAPPPPGIPHNQQAAALPVPERTPRNITLPDTANPNTQHVSTQDLPADTIAGVYATGVRTTWIVPAGTAGNERDITVTSETWTSPDLKIVVRQITEDPRSGKVTTELTNISRADPDPTLFQAPEGYTIRDSTSLLSPAR